jgi:hypothetical protein
MAAWSVVLNPTSDPLTDSTAELDLSSGSVANGVGYRLLEGLAFPPPQPQPVYASSYDTDGSISSDPAHYENRTITVPLRVGGSTAADLETKLNALYKQIGQINREGGSLKLTTPNSTVCYFDLVPEAMGGCEIGHAYAGRNRADVTLELVARPFWRGAEADLGSNSETTLPWLIFTDTGIDGDLPALGRLVVTDSQGVDQWTVIVGVQSRYYSNAASAALAFQAEDLTPLGTSTDTAGAGGASGTNVIRNTDLVPSYQAILRSEIDASNTALTHKGDFRVWVRLYRPTGNTGEVSVRLEWGLGDYLRTTLNDPVDYAANDREGVFTWANLGTVHIPATSTQWEFRLLAKSTVTGDELDADAFVLFPTTEGYVELSGVQQFQTPTSFSARDEFDQSAGALSGKTAPVGGVWAEAGDVDDAVVNATTHQVERTQLSDATFGQGLTLPVSMTNMVVQIDTASGVAQNNSGTSRHYVQARWVDENNFFAAALVFDGFSGWHVMVVKRVASVNTYILNDPSSNPTYAPSADDVWRTLRVQIDAAGRWSVWAGLQGAPPDPIISGVDSALATGGALASGRPGFRDERGTSFTRTRYYDNFLAFVPAVDAAVYANQSLELRHDRATRENSGGTFSTSISKVDGNYLRIPPAGPESRTARLVVKGFRHDPYTSQDGGIDDIGAQLFVTPRGLVVPEA